MFYNYWLLQLLKQTMQHTQHFLRPWPLTGEELVGSAWKSCGCSSGVVTEESLKRQNWGVSLTHLYAFPLTTFNSSPPMYKSKTRKRPISIPLGRQGFHIALGDLLTSPFCGCSRSTECEYMRVHVTMKFSRLNVHKIWQRWQFLYGRCQEGFSGFQKCTPIAQKWVRLLFWVSASIFSD